MQVLSNGAPGCFFAARSRPLKQDPRPNRCRCRDATPAATPRKARNAAKPLLSVWFLQPSLQRAGPEAGEHVRPLRPVKIAPARMDQARTRRERPAAQHAMVAEPGRRIVGVGVGDEARDRVRTAWPSIPRRCRKDARGAVPAPSAATGPATAMVEIGAGRGARGHGRAFPFGLGGQAATGPCAIGLRFERVDVNHRLGGGQRQPMVESPLVPGAPLPGANRRDARPVALAATASRPPTRARAARSRPPPRTPGTAHWSRSSAPWRTAPASRDGPTFRCRTRSVAAASPSACPASSGRRQIGHRLHQPAVAASARAAGCVRRRQWQRQRLQRHQQRFDVHVLVVEGKLEEVAVAIA